MSPLHPILSTQHNFRDLGGIVAIDGRHVKHGLLFRSGDLFSISADDISILEDMKLLLVIDFRAQRESDRRPNKTISTVKEIIHLRIHDRAREQAEKFLEENDAAGLETVLVGDYRRMVRTHAAEFRDFLHILEKTDNLPLVYHCAAGKDRTGLATVFLLTALGVAMPVIWEDYLVTNLCMRAAIEKFISKISESGLNGEILRPMMEVRREYLEAALDEILEISGSLEKFVTEVLKADTRKLREKYLEGEPG